MNIPEAIQVLEKAQEKTTFVGEHPLRTAQQLGIEALKRELEYRQWSIPMKNELLPGETVEEEQPK